jgi:hypothetical protein
MLKNKMRPHMRGANSEGIEMSEVWKTKYGPRRVRRDPPTVAEAVAAARGLTDDVQEQIEIAAALMDLPPEQVKPEVLKAATARKDASTVAFVGRAGAPRTVVVERVPSRRPTAAAGKPAVGTNATTTIVTKGTIVSKGLTGRRIGREG